MRVETIGDDGVIDGVKKNVLCCAMSEMPFGEEVRGKSVCLLTSEEWRRRFCDYAVFGPSLATCVKCLIDFGCLFWIRATHRLAVLDCLESLWLLCLLKMRSLGDEMGRRVCVV